MTQGTKDNGKEIQCDLSVQKNRSQCEASEMLLFCAALQTSPFFISLFFT